MKFKNINLSKETIALLIALGVIVGIDRGCSSHEKVDTTAIDKEIKAAQTSLDSVATLHDAAAAQRDAYQKRYYDLCPVVGQPEAPSVRAAKDAEWIQVRDSLSKYRDETTVQQIAKDWAQLRVDTLMSKRNRMKLR
ncbi:MAG: hypothetical protein K2L25_01490 [Alphaproteobacteria bacterium]|nr:hypothetical protein [Alphaproteobacteria bacterium]